MNRAVLLMMAGVSACGSGSTRSPSGEAICARLADHLEVRLRAHEADLPRLRSGLHADTLARHQQRLSATVTDFVATQTVAERLGSTCSSALEIQECRWRPPFLVDHSDDTLNDALAGGSSLLEGFRGRGPCAPADTGLRDRRRCSDLAMYLRAEDATVKVAEEGWRTPFEADGTWTPHAHTAAQLMADWRALVDYGLALAPLCVPDLAPGCAHLRDGLTDAPPAALADRVRALQTAYMAGRPCPPPRPTGP